MYIYICILCTFIYIYTDSLIPYSEPVRRSVLKAGVLGATACRVFMGLAAANALLLMRGPHGATLAVCSKSVKLGGALSTYNLPVPVLYLYHHT